MKNIRSFIIGSVVASAIFISYSVSADTASSIVGDDGELNGIDVVTDRGETLCRTPLWR